MSIRRVADAELTRHARVFDELAPAPPGTTINAADVGWVSPALQAAARRR